MQLLETLSVNYFIIVDFESEIRKIEAELKKNKPKFKLVSNWRVINNKDYFFDDINDAHYFAQNSEFIKYEIFDIEKQELICSVQIPVEEQEVYKKPHKKKSKDPHGIWDMYYPDREENEDIDIDDFFKD